MSGRLHVRGDRRERVDDVCHVMEAFASFSEPISMDARTGQRFDQLVLRGAVVERQLQCPFGGHPAIFATFALRSEDPATPRPGRKSGVKLARGQLEIAYDERDLERRTALKRRNDVFKSRRLPLPGQPCLGQVRECPPTGYARAVSSFFASIAA